MLIKNLDIKSIRLTKDFFQINWYVTGWCNFSCPYCITNHLKNPWIKEEDILIKAQQINKLINTFYTNRKIALKLIGGEVTYYNLIKVLNNIEHLDKVVLITNFSRELDYFYELENYCFNRRIQLVLICSLHKENKDFKEKFITLTNWCRSKPHDKISYKDPQLTLVVDLDFDKDILQDYLNNNIWRIRLTRLRLSNQSNKPLSKEVLDYIAQYNKIYQQHSNPNQKVKRNTYELEFKNGQIEGFTCASNITNHLDENGFIPDDYYCSAGVDSIAILPDGNVIKARCAYLENDIICNINDLSNYQVFKESVVCHLNQKNNIKDKRCDLCAGTNLCRRDD